MRKHKPPSQVRYEKSHPVVSFRLNKELKEHLKKILGTQSFAEFVKEGLGAKTRERKILEEERKRSYDKGYSEGAEAAKKREKKILEDERKRAHDEGYNEGYHEGGEAGYYQSIDDFAIRAPCAICGKDMVIRSPRKRHYIATHIVKRGWSHPTCKYDLEDKRRRENR